MHIAQESVTIIYIHGVSVRDPSHGERLKAPFMRWLGPKVVSNAGQPAYIPVYWGDAAAKFRWDLDSRPKTQLLRQGGADVFAGLGSLREASAHGTFDERPAGNGGLVSPRPSGPVLGAGAAAVEREAPPLSSVPLSQRADFLADLYLAVRPRRQAQDPIADEPHVAALADAAASVAAVWEDVIRDGATEEERAARLLSAIETALSGSGELLQQGGFRDWMSRAGEALKRATFWPADAVSTVFAELRPVAHEFIARFIGDVLVYLTERDASHGSGEIPNRVLAALKSAHDRKQSTGERIIVVTHSMGGQLFYDAVTHYAPAVDALKNLRVDHWISCGAQVSLFAELGTFKGQAATKKPAKLERPLSVAAWTNYYDRNDLVGFIMEPVFDGVKDREYNTGYGLAFAHSGFLARPSFFEAVAREIAGSAT